MNTPSLCFSGVYRVETPATSRVAENEFKKTLAELPPEVRENVPERAPLFKTEDYVAVASGSSYLPATSGVVESGPNAGSYLFVDDYRRHDAEPLLAIDNKKVRDQVPDSVQGNLRRALKWPGILKAMTEQRQALVKEMAQKPDGVIKLRLEGNRFRLVFEPIPQAE